MDISDKYPPAVILEGNLRSEKQRVTHSTKALSVSEERLFTMKISFGNDSGDDRPEKTSQ